MVKYDSSLLSLAKPEEGVLATAGKALQNSSDWYWQNRLANIKENLANEQLNQAQIATKRSESALLNDTLNNEQKALTLQTLQKTQPFTIEKAKAEANIANTQANFLPQAQKAQNANIQAQTGAILANTRLKNHELENAKQNQKAFLDTAVPLMVKENKDNNVYFNDIYNKMQNYNSLINDPNLPLDNKELALKEKEKLSRAASSLLNNGFVNAQQTSTNLNGDLAVKLRNLNATQSAQVNYISKIQTRMGLLEEALTKIDPNFGLQGYIAAGAWKKFGNEEAKAIVKNQIDAIRQEARTAKGSRLLKQDLESLDRIYEDPYKFLGNAAGLRTLKNAIATSAISEANGLKESARLSGRGNLADLEEFENQTKEFFKPYLYTSEQALDKPQIIRGEKKAKPPLESFLKSD